VRFTKVVGPPSERVKSVGIRRLPARYADRQNVARKDEPAEETVTPSPAARPDRPAVKPASYLVVSLLFSMLLFGLFLVGDHGFLSVRRQGQELVKAQNELQALVDENRKLETELAALKSDPRAVEKIAREKLGLVKPGEVVLILPDGWERRVRPAKP
jgi:cell division protein FtsB